LKEILKNGANKSHFERRVYYVESN
jgi:hypothetical protein